MKKFSLLTLTAFLCVLSLLLSLCACTPTPPDNGDPEQDPPAPPTAFTITAETVIIRADEDREHLEAAQLLYQRLNEILDCRLTFRTDYEKPYPCEIVVGSSNREGASEFCESLSSRDYGYRVINENLLVISGGNGESSIQAVEHFLQTVFGAEGTAPEAPVTLLVGNSEIVPYEYPIKTLTFAGKPLSDFTITYSTGSASREAAQALAEMIEEKTGIVLPVQLVTETLTTAESILVQLDNTLGDFVTTYESVENSFVIRASSSRLEMAVTTFLADAWGDEPTGVINVEKTDGLVSNLLLSDVEYYDLKFQEITDTVKVCAGVTRYSMHYIDRNGLPVVAYVIECAPGSVTPVLGTANGEYSIDTTQSILKQIEYEEAINGTDICAAVNGCFYTPDPLGLNIKYGQILCDNFSESYPSFGVKKDGSYYFGYPGKGGVNKEDLEFAVGGAFLLLKDGGLYDMGLSWADQGIVRTRHPRTGIGAKEDGTLFFVVVDGRQDHSNGATLPDFAMIFQDLGCKDAVNIDGGGSSISYTKNYETGEYVYWNSPSDGSPRSIKCSTLLARNPNYREEQ